jgi:hypothetical protein
MKLPRQIWKDVKRGENLDLYVTVALAIILVVVNTLGLNLPEYWTESLILAILALLAVTILGNRQRLDSVLKSLPINTNSAFQIQFSEDVQNELEDQMDSAKEIYVFGVAAEGTLHKHYHRFKHILQRGCTLNIVLVDPYSSTCELVAKKQYRPISSETWKTKIVSSINQFHKLRTETSGKMEIRIIDFPLSRGGILVDPVTSKGKIYMWEYSFKTIEPNVPKFVFTANDDYWYNHYKEEFMAIWNEANEWVPF